MRYLLINKSAHYFNIISYKSEHKMARDICESFISTIDYSNDDSIRYQNDAHAFKESFLKKDYLRALNYLHKLFDLEGMGIYYVSEDHKRISKSLEGKFKVVN